VGGRPCVARGRGGSTWSESVRGSSPPTTSKRYCRCAERRIESFEKGGIEGLLSTEKARKRRLPPNVRGAMITNAATNANNVVGPVYVAAFVPDEGETLVDIASDSKESVLKTLLMQLQYPSGQGEETAVEFAILDTPRGPYSEYWMRSMPSGTGPGRIHAYFLFSREPMIR
jgi:hypothetical protein